MNGHIMGRAQARSARSLHPRHKLRYDMAYISPMSPWLDIERCVLCVGKVLRKAVRRRRRAAAQEGPDSVSPAAHRRACAATTAAVHRGFTT